jgi:signal transduction histidine kinase
MATRWVIVVAAHRGPGPGWAALVAFAAAGALGTVVLLVRGRRHGALVARAGHELRGPLCAALLGLERIAAECGPAVAPAVAAVELELRRAAAALDDLDGRPRRVRAEIVDVGALLDTAAAGWRALAAEHGSSVAVEAASGLVVRADHARLAQACGNLVANAVEHGGGAVRVRARALGGAVRVEVTDDGPGLPAPVDALLTRARGRRARRGHGLAVAAEVARRHGGRLAAGPSPRGARLVLELPPARVDALEVAPS